MLTLINVATVFILNQIIQSHGIGCALHGYLVGKTWSCDKFYKTPNEYYDYMRTNIKNGG